MVPPEEGGICPELERINKEWQAADPEKEDFWKQQQPEEIES